MTEEAVRRIVLAQRPKGKPTAADFRLEETSMPVPGAGQLLLKVRYLSLDPYMRGRMDDKKSYAPPVAIGEVMAGQSLCEVVLGNSAEYHVGDLVLANTGWQTHFVCEGKGLRTINAADAPISTSLGVLGMPGFTAWSGMKEIGKPAPGDTVVVAAATGPVGSLVGQLAKKAGARAVGIAGGAKKCKALKDNFGFDCAVDHRSRTFAADLQAACPKGIDVYFENVGGAVWQAVLPLLNKYARVPVCGLIAQYNGQAAGATSEGLYATMQSILANSLSVRGFINYEFIALMPEFLNEVGPGVRDGKIKYEEDIVIGFENAPEAFMGMLEGKNHGKLLVYVSD
jgi:NADPH-dependent curcumin reductase CurA